MLYTQLFLKGKLAKTNLMKITLKEVKKMIKITNLSENEFKKIGFCCVYPTDDCYVIKIQLDNLQLAFAVI